MKKLISLLLVMMLVVTLFAACGEKADDEMAKDEKQEETKDDSKETKDDSKDATEESSDGVYPLDGRTITYWTPEYIHPDYPTQAESPLMQEMFARTGVEVEFVHQTAKEAFSLMVAAGEMTDVYKTNLVRNYPGGPSAAIEQGVAMELNDVFAEYAPNLTAYLEANPQVDKLIKTDDGSYYCFPFVRGGDFLTVFVGPMLRKDLLDELGLDTPETIDEWEVVLKGFKDLGVPAPLTGEMAIYQDANPFVGAYNTSFDMHLEDGEIVYGPTKEGFKDFLKLFQRWYAEGLIDPDLATVDKDQVAAKMTSGDSAAAVGHTGSRMGAWLTAAAEEGGYDLVATKYPTINKGDMAEFGQSQMEYFGFGVSLSSTCEDVEAAARFLDYGYGEEGHMLYNFGIEGESYEMIDGYPTYTDHILNNPDGVSTAQMLKGYVQSSYNGPLIQDVRYMEQYAQYQQQKDAINVWKQTNNSAHRMPPVTLNEDEANEVSAIRSEIKAYVDEFFFKSMFGDVDIDAEWDDYVATIEKMGVQEMLDNYTQALDRFNAR